MVVGEEEWEFILHQYFLNKTPGSVIYSDSAKHIGNETYVLKKTDPTIFQAYVHWIYTSEIDIRLLPDTEEIEEKVKPTWPGLAKLWVLTDDLGDITLCNSLMDMMVDKFNPHSQNWNKASQEDPDGLVHAYGHVFSESGTLYDSKIQDLFCDMFSLA